MSNGSSNKQNGRHTPTPVQPPAQRHLQEPAEANTVPEICRDFIWGTCTKSSACRYRHELDFEEMTKVLKFCRDYQNRPGCKREDCTYLHTTKEEQNLFMTTGRLPRVIAERHMNMLAASNSVETISQIAHFIKESYGATPPPPPPTANSAPPTGDCPRPTSRELMPPPLTPSTRPTSLTPGGDCPRPTTTRDVMLSPPTTSTRPTTLPPGVPALPSVVLPAMSTPISTPMPTAMPAMMPTSMHTPVANSLTPVTPTVPTVTATVIPPLYTAPPPSVYPVDVPPPSLPAVFDASRPPPPLPKTGTTKRKLSDEAGPSKLRKAEHSKTEDDSCRNCLQHNLRFETKIKTCRIEEQQLEIEEEIQKFIVNKKSEDYENLKSIFRGFVRPEMGLLLDEQAEGVPHLQLQDILAENNQAPFVPSGLSSLIRVFMDLISNSRNTTPPRFDDAFLQSIANLSRRPSTTPSTQNVLDMFAELIRNSNSTSERGVPAKNSPSGSNNGINVFEQFNGQKAEDASTAPRPSTSSYMADQPAPLLPGPSGVPPPPIEAAIAMRPPGFPNFPLSVPPPNRPFFAPPYVVPTNTIPQNQNYRGVPPQYAARGPALAIRAMNMNNKDCFPYNLNNNRYPPPQ